MGVGAVPRPGCAEYGLALAQRLLCFGSWRCPLLRKAFTLVEVTTVIAIVAVLAAIVFAVSGPSRESARRGSCVQQLRQFHHAYAMYASDWDATGAYAELHGLSYVSTGLRRNLRPYVKNLELYFCPSLPRALRKNLSSNYAHYLFIRPLAKDGSMSLERKRMIELEARLGLATPIMTCTVHDELHFASGERHIHPKEASPFLVQLRLDGSVRQGRVRTARDFIVTRP